MLYHSFKDKSLSALGLGCMRLPTLPSGEIDEVATAEMVDYALSHGINYYDTARGYHDGNSETVIGKLLSKYPRDSYYIATKFPGYDISNMDKVREIFPRQLEKTGMEYFDFYLIHNVCERNIDHYLNEDYGIMEYLLEQKKVGKIRHLGFSNHGDIPVMQRFLDAYAPYMEFCQIQLNWLDYDFQNARGKLELLKKYNMPVWVMEPLRGGKLATISPENEAKLKVLREDETVVGWGFRWLQSFPQICVTLSGMSDLEQIKQNIEIFSNHKPATPQESEVLYGIAKDMTNSVPCTACRYCTEKCPEELDIPLLIELYNEHNFSGGGFLAPMRLSSLPKHKRPFCCIGCRRCEKVCPQQIKISEVFADFCKKLKK